MNIKTTTLQIFRGDSSDRRLSTVTVSQIDEPDISGRSPLKYMLPQADVEVQNGDHTPEKLDTEENMQKDSKTVNTTRHHLNEQRPREVTVSPRR